MLVLSRKLGERVCIGKDITITVVEVRGNRIKLAIQAPDSISILRGELQDALDEGSLGHPGANLVARSA
jgi:carbon storage regulator